MGSDIGPNWVVERPKVKYNDKTGKFFMWMHIDSRDFMFGSKLTGWDPNDNVYRHSTSLSGGWSGWEEFADDGSNTYHSKTTYILPYGPGGQSFMYIGNRWASSNIQASTYVWLPLEITGTKAWLRNRPGGWVPNLDPETGTESTSC
ncbi:hypothetical protein B0T21DRAFT_414627 [Apiosordaria backusii]|uniref:Uncharacterized protein n=1 Tax=Apiosordaria backusii TaxID=314023 RepID=A0AA40DZI3_9PEZI|nr:hypothetical protein B0T21DRAFT_414627 [Apiosordaria backusii]